MEKVTNKDLLDLCFSYTGGDWSYDELSVCVLKDLVDKAIKLVDNVICKVRFGQSISLEECSCISARQLCCFENAFSYIDKRMYTNALHEFMDCVDDYGKARTTNSLISLNEAITYYSILLKFKGVLESES